MSLILFTLYFCLILHDVQFSSAFAFDGYEEALVKNQVHTTTLSKPTTEPIKRNAKIANTEVLDLYCYDSGTRMSLQTLWTSACFEVRVQGGRVYIYSGMNESSVFHLFQKEHMNWNWKSLFSSSQWPVCVSPFMRSCIGVNTVHEYSLQFVVTDIDYVLVGFMISGILLFLTANSLCRCALFYYLVGICIGVTASILIIFVVVGKFFTKKYTIIALSFISGSSLMIWFLQWIWNNLQTAFQIYYEYLVGYLAISCVVSFSVCYYFGPITNERLLNLIKWFLQAVAFLMIYYGTPVTVISTTVVMVLVISQICSYLRTPDQL